jgi:hypothetical protein
MSIEQVVEDLEEERNRLDRAIQILRGVRTRTRTFTRTGTKPALPLPDARSLPLVRAQCPRELAGKSVSRRRRDGQSKWPGRSSVAHLDSVNMIGLNSNPRS